MSEEVAAYEALSPLTRWARCRGRDALGVLWALPPPEPPLLLVEVNLRTGPDLCANTRAAVRGAAVGVQDGLALGVVVHRADLILLLRYISSLFLLIFFLFHIKKGAKQKTG